jgi:hypothetical protein
MSRLVVLAFVLAALPPRPGPPTLTCETSGTYRHCLVGAGRLCRRAGR